MTDKQIEIMEMYNNPDFYHTSKEEQKEIHEQFSEDAN